MTTEKLNDAKNLEMHIKSLKNDLQDISIYEKAEDFINKE